MADRTPAETLRAAAAKLRETAKPAHAAPWHMDADECGRGWDVRSWINGRHLAFGLAEADARWVALASPVLAEPFAELLEHMADDMSDDRAEEREFPKNIPLYQRMVVGDVEKHRHDWTWALRTARAILGEAS